MKWEVWLRDRQQLELDFKNYLGKKTIRKGATDNEIDGHLEKAKRNLRFSRIIIDDIKDYYD